MDECKDEQTIVKEIAGIVQGIKAAGVEPGVEISTGLACLIDHTCKESIEGDCDMTLTARDILVGAFRSNRHVILEARKTIHVLVKEVLKAVFHYRGNMEAAIQGLLDGISLVSREHHLNEQEALVIAREDILLVVENIDPAMAVSLKRRP